MACSKGLWNATLAMKDLYLPVSSIACSRHHDAPARSLTEATFGNFMRRTDKSRNWVAEKSTLKMQQKYSVPGRDQFTPDYSLYYVDKENNRIVGDVIDIKGKDLTFDETQQELARVVPTAVCNKQWKRTKDGKSFVCRSVIIFNPNKIRIYDAAHCDDTEGTEAGIYLCPECGRIEILPPWRLKCTTCGHEFNIDNVYCEPSFALQAFHQKRTSTSKRAQKLKDAFRQRAKEKGLEVIDADNGEEQALIMRLEPETPDGTVYVADFAYVSEHYGTKHYGQKNQKPLKLQTQVFVFDDLDDVKNRPIVNEIMQHAADKETAIDAVVFVSNAGLEITERYKVYSEAVRRPAKWFVCDACGQTYLASEQLPACPFCNGEYAKED